jgi:hypothetical protein
MKHLKLLFLAVGLFIQGCSFETPLFKDEDGLKPDEAVVVFNLYVRDCFADWIFDIGLKEVYATLVWEGSQQIIIRTINYLSAKGINQKYLVAKVVAGSYFLDSLHLHYSKYNAHITITSPGYQRESSPLKFTVAPAEVKYLGDIELFKSHTSVDHFQPIFIIYNKVGEARRFMEQKYPSLAVKLKESFIEKSNQQLFLEQQYLPADSSDLLKDIKNAR